MLSLPSREVAPAPAVCLKPERRGQRAPLSSARGRGGRVGGWRASARGRDASGGLAFHALLGRRGGGMSCRCPLAEQLGGGESVQVRVFRRRRWLRRRAR